MYKIITNISLEICNKTCDKKNACQHHIPRNKIKGCDEKTIKITKKIQKARNQQTKVNIQFILKVLKTTSKYK